MTKEDKKVIVLSIVFSIIYLCIFFGGLILTYFLFKW